MDIGIDLGTTFSVVAVKGRPAFVKGYPEGLYLEECDTTIIQTPECEPTIPSVVLLNQDSHTQSIVGMEAKQAAENGICPVMWSKRKMGTTEKLEIGSRSILAMDAATEILKYLKAMAERAIGQPVTRAVVTHPAYFDRSQVEETREAAKRAGFDMSSPEQMLMEPKAAALAYTKSNPKDPLRIMVYDLGGGTFDVTILERKKGVINSKAFDGDRLMGGYNFDRKLAEWIREQLKAKGRKVRYDANNPEDRGMQARLMAYCESLKIRLADMGQHKKIPIDVQPDFLVDEQGKKIQVRERISQEDFVKLIQEDLDMTIDCCFRCLEKANLYAKDLDYVLLVGGSTHALWVEEIVKDKLKIETLSFRPDLCVAAGAAIHAESLPKIIGDTSFKAKLNIHPKSILPTTNVGGHLIVSDPAILKGLTVLLKNPVGKTLGPIVVADDGGFLFQDVDLLEDGSTDFNLLVTDKNGITRLNEQFSITYSPENDGIIDDKTSLPKPLYIKTASGMRALAEEGKILPSEEITMELQRLHSEPSLEIPVYQNDEKIGAIRISDIPAEAGEGAKIILKVIITDNNLIKGTAQVLVARSNIVAAECPVKIFFPPIAVPDMDELEKRFRELENELAEKIVMTDDPQLRTLLVSKGGKLVDKLKKLFAEPVPERQEIVKELRNLDRIVNPPQDDMEPPRAQFDSLIIQCRSLLANKQDDPQIQSYVGFLDRIEREGQDAFTRKDQKKWSAVNDSLIALYRKIKPREVDPSPLLLPTLILKDQAVMQISQLRASLATVRESLMNKNIERYKSVLKQRCDKLEQILDQMEDKVLKIDDELEPHQGYGQVQLAMRPLPQLHVKIDIDWIEEDTNFVRK